MKSLWVWPALAIIVAGLLVYVCKFAHWTGMPRLSGPSDGPVCAATGGTKRMAARLKQLAEVSDPERNPFLNSRRVEIDRKALAQAQGLAGIVQARLQLGYELVLAGETEEAVQILDDVSKTFSSPGIHAGLATIQKVRELRAICYMRLGEQENCCALHSPDSCLMPIQGRGIHTKPRGSRGAIEALTSALGDAPNDPRYRWLLNIAYMTLGEWPDKVPPQWLIPPKTFVSDIEFPRFMDIAPEIGVDHVGLSGGAIMEDFDGDGNLDLMCSGFGLTEQMRYFHNNADGTFTDRTDAAGLMGEISGLQCVQTDYNNDRRPDVLVLRGAWLRDQGKLPLSLLRNCGGGTFEDVTEAAGLLGHMAPTQAGAWGDYDGDGWLDLFIGNETANPADSNPCELYHNNRDGTFTNVAGKAGLALTGFVKGAAWGDFNNDGRPDLYLSRLGEPNMLFRNDGPRAGDPGACVFTDVTKQAGVAEPVRSFSCWFWDFDNDGWEDILAASFTVTGEDALGDNVLDYLGQPNHGEFSRLYHNNHDGTFSDVTRAMKLDKVMLAMGSNFGDLDNDGWPDCYFGTGDPLLTTLVPNRMFRNAEGKVFQDVTTAGGFGHLQKGHGIAFGDLDNDGDQDIYENIGGAYEGDVFQRILFENPGFGNHWITLRLEGVKANRAAIGARIKVCVKTKSGPRDIQHIVSTGSSFGGNSLQAEIGLGNATAIDSIEVRWPGSNLVQTFAAVAMDQFVQIREGDAQARPVAVKRLHFSKTASKEPIAQAIE